MMGSKYTIIQLENENYDIITYVNFVKQAPSRTWKAHEAFLKPIIWDQ